MIGPVADRPPLSAATRIAITAVLWALLAFGPAYPAGQAQAKPGKPVRIITGSGAGGGLDLQVRIVRQALARLIGEDVVIENRPGGGGIIAGQAVAGAPPDGNTLFAYGGDLFSVAALMPRTTFDANKQLVPISQISATPLLVVTGGRSIFNDINGMIAAAKASPQGLTYATFAVASVNNVAGQWIAKEAHIKLLNIPFRAGAEGALATAAGNVSLAIVAPAAVYPSMVNTGSVKVIGLTGAKRPSYLPTSWPTFAEKGLPIDAGTFFGIFGPAGMSNATIARLDRAFAAALNDNAVRQQLRNIGVFAEYLGPAACAKRIETERNRYDRIIREMHMVEQQR